jgi:hypothetical protein
MTRGLVDGADAARRSDKANSVTIERLMAVVPPPAAPSQAFRGPWEPVEAEIGRELPPDYKDFVRLYGGGDFFRGTVMIYVAGAASPGARLEAQVPLVCDTFTALGDDRISYRLWPEADGLIPLGGTNGGDYIFWLPEGEPAAWNVVVWGRGLGSFEVFDCDVTDFLAGLASGEILPREFPELGLSDPLFEPFPPDPDWSRRFAVASANPLRLSWRLGRYGTGASGVSTSRLRDEKE